MATKSTLAVFVLLAIPAAFVHCFTEWCDADHDRRLEQVIEGTLSGIPGEHSSRIEADAPHRSSVGLETYRVSGLNHLHRHGPLRSYCGNGTQVVNFDLLSPEPILCSFHWTAGGNGSLDLAAHATRVKTQLKFVPGPSGGSGVVATRILDENDEPVTTSVRVGRVTLHIDDPTGDNTKATAGFLRHLALAAVQDSWEDVFVPRLVQALKEV